ncbi:MAG: methyltransferase [bacterium]|nr:methyltransferase [bacterium]
MIFFDTFTLFLVVLWAVVWFFFLFAGRRIKRRLPLHQHLVWYSSAVFLFVTLFYYAAFSGVGNLAGYIKDGIRFFGALVSILGAGMLIAARCQLHELTLGEVFFTKSESYLHTGLYHYFKHPMYVGLSLILIGSLVIYPNILAMFFMALTLFSIKKKKDIEEGETSDKK